MTILKKENILKSYQTLLSERQNELNEATIQDLSTLCGTLCLAGEYEQNIKNSRIAIHTLFEFAYELGKNSK